jgi:hypothetical protein
MLEEAMRVDVFCPLLELKPHRSWQARQGGKCVPRIAVT